MAAVVWFFRVFFILFAMWAGNTSAHANTEASSQPLRLAVAANFKSTLEALVEAYQSLHSCQQESENITISVASSGVLANQIARGAPFHLFFSADEEKVDWLQAQDKGKQAKVYALGQLVLWAPAAQTDDLLTYLSQIKNSSNKLALANPKLAPYGKAAQETLIKLAIYSALTPNVVKANNVAQVAQFVSTGAAKAGFVAASQLPKNARYISVEASFYQPIKQKVLLIGSNKDEDMQKRSERFYCFLNSAESRAIMQKNGYALPAVKNDENVAVADFCGKVGALR